MTSPSSATIELESYMGSMRQIFEIISASGRQDAEQLIVLGGKRWETDVICQVTAERYQPWKSLNPALYPCLARL